MKKEFVAPSIDFLDINDTAEGLEVGGSGYVPVTPPVDQSGDWDIRCEYRNHNSGSHSEVAIIGYNRGNKSGDCLSVNFEVRGFKLDTIKDTGGVFFFDVTDSAFSMVRSNHFNPGERFEFNIQITAKDSEYKGAVGKTGEQIPCTIYCKSYRAS